MELNLLEGWYTYAVTLKTVLLQVTFKTLSALDWSDLKKNKRLLGPGIPKHNFKYT